MIIKDITNKGNERLSMVIEFGPDDFKSIKDSGMLEHLFYEEIGRRIVNQLKEQKEIITERITKRYKK
jgi:hypothetical protein